MPIQSTAQLPQEQLQRGQPIQIPMDQSLSGLTSSQDQDDQGNGIDPTPEPYDHYDNLVESLEKEVLTKIGQTVLRGFEKDLESRSEWEETIKKGLLALGTTIDENDDPFEGACGAYHPLILEAAVKFQSKATAEVLPASGPVRTQVMGAQTDEKIQAAKRVKDFLNYQIMNVMTEYVPDMERLLFYLPLYGSAFKKTYWNTGLARPESCFISPDNFVINYTAKSIEKARRHTEILPPVSGAELKKRIANGDFVEPKDWKIQGSVTKASDDITGNSDLGGSGTFYIPDVTRTADRAAGMQSSYDDDGKIYTLLEQHCYLKLSNDVFAVPYVVTVEKDAGTVLSIRRNWKENDLSQKKRTWYSHYQYVPGLGFYGLGLFHLLGNFNVTLTAVIRSLVDSGQFANMQGGFKLKGIRIVGDNGSIAPGEWKDVEGAVQDLQKAFFPLPYKEPSQVLFQMLQYLETRGQQFADSTEQVISDSTNYGPVGTTVALLEASMKLFNAIHKRVHFAQKTDLKILAEINYEYLDDSYPYDLPNAQGNVFKKDFDPKVVAVIPVSDPNITSQAHRLNLANAKLQAAMLKPELHNMKKVFWDFYDAAGVENIELMLPPDAQAQPLDPLGDLMAIVKGTPIQAFNGQNHQAHIQFKTTWLDDPIIGGKNPQNQPFVPQVTANIREHMIMQFQEQVQGVSQQMGGQQQGGAQASDPKTLAAIQAQAAAQVAQANKALNAITQGDDPMHVIAAAEMKKADTAEQKEKDDLMIKKLQLALQAKDQQLKETQASHDRMMEKSKLGIDTIGQAGDQAIRRFDSQTNRKQALRPPTKGS